MRFFIPPWIRLSAFAATAFVIWACFGGTGTDTENGVSDISRNLPPGAVATRMRVVDSAGAPLAGVELRVQAPRFRPDSAGGVGPLLDTGLHTSTAGLAVLRLRAPGVYILDGRYLGMSLLLDTLRVWETKPGDTVNFRAATPRTMKGAMRLASGFQFDTGWVFIRGTSLLSPIGKNGAYDFGLIPTVAAKMALGLRYQSHAKSANFVLVKPDSVSGKLQIVPASALNSPSSCLDSLPGSPLASLYDGKQASFTDSVLAQAARQACTGRVGSLVQVQLADSANRAIRLLGTFVVSDTTRIQGAPGFKFAPAVLSAGCISNFGDIPGHETYRLPSTLVDEILVNDISGADSCRAPWESW